VRYIGTLHRASLLLCFALAATADGLPLPEGFAYSLFDPAFR